jgi:DinB superfamily
MSTPTEAQVLAHMMDRTREYTLSYFNRIKDEDLHRRFVCEGKPLNTAYWLMAHMATTENGLLLMATGGPFSKFSWAKHFTLGAPGLPAEECPPIAEMLEMFHAVHKKAMAHLPTLPAEALELPNRTGLSAIGTTVRDVITHAIRHEGSHIGHLGWLCKLYGVKTM